MRIRVLSLLTLLALCSHGDLVFAAAAEKPKDDRVVKDGMMVSLDYTLKGTDGKVIETSKGRDPLKYIHGQKMMIPGLEKELTGMKVGGEKHVTVKPEDGYGKVNPNAVQEIPKEKIPPNALKVGAVLAAKSPEGMVVPMTVRQIKENTVVMDMNHPMAGKTLVFDVKVVDIQPPPPAQSTKSAAPAAPVTPAQPQVTIEPNAVRRHTDDSTINELVRVIQARGYKCDSVSAAIPWPVNPGYTVRCNQFNYTYRVEDKGGRWVVSVQ